MQEINVLHLRSSGGFFGAEKNIIMASQIFRNSPIKICIGCINYNDNKNVALLAKAKENGINSISIPGKRGLDFSLINKIVTIIREKNITILETHGYKENFVGYFAAKKTRIKIIGNVHGWTGHSLRVIAYEFLDKILLKFFDKIIVISPIQKKQLMNIGIPENKITFIPNYIDVNSLPRQSGSIELKTAYGIRKEDIIVGSVGRLSPEKGYQYLLKAMATLKKINNLKLILVGNGQEEKKLMRLAEDLKIRDKVIFAGYQANVFNYIEIFDIFVLSSLTEGFPNVLLEALGCKKPVVATNVGAIDSIIKHNVTGYLTNAKDFQGLAQGINYFLTNKDEAQKMANTGYDLIKESYSKKSKIILMESIYYETINSN